MMLRVPFSCRPCLKVTFSPDLRAGRHASVAVSVDEEDELV